MPRRGRSNTMARRYKGRPDTFRTDLVLYIGNNITKFDNLSLNIRQNNGYYRFGSHVLKITSKFVEFFRNNTFYKINIRNLRENGRQATYY